MLPQLILFEPSYSRVNFNKYFKAFFMFFLNLFLKKRWYNKCYPNWFCLSLAIVDLILVNVLKLFFFFLNFFFKKKLKKRDVIFEKPLWRHIWNADVVNILKLFYVFFEVFF